MKLSEIMSELAVLELDNMGSGRSIGYDPVLEEGEISVEDQRKIITGLNDALSFLHTSYIMRRNTTDFFIVSGVRKYVVDNPDLIQILYVDLPEETEDRRVYHTGSTYVNRFSILNKNTILFHEDPKTMTGTVEYQASHPRLSFTGSYEDQDVLVPDYMIEPLRALTASKVFSVMGTEAAQAKAVELQNKFNSLIAILEARGMLEVGVPINRRDFRQSGFL